MRKESNSKTLKNKERERRIKKGKRRIKKVRIANKS